MSFVAGHFRVRIGKIRPRDAKIRPLHPNLEFRKVLAVETGRIIDSFMHYAHKDGESMAGMAVVLWSDAGSTISFVKTDTRFNNIPYCLIPDMVRGKLESHYASNLMDDKIKDALK